MTSLEEIKIVVLNPSGDKQWATGGERRLWEIQAYLKKRTNNVQVISFLDFPFKINAIHFLQANIWLFQKIKTQYSDKNRMVFIYPASCSLFTFLAMVLLKIMCQTRIIVTVEHFKNPLSPSLKSLLARTPWFFANIICLHSAHLIIGVSKSTERECRKMGVNARKIRIVPNGIDKIINVANQDRLAKQNEIVDILFIGYCARIKGINYLLEAIRLLKKKGQDNYFFHFVGDTQKDPNYFRKIQKFIHANSLDDRIRFYGQMYDKDLEYLWDKTDIFILPSLWESFGLVIIEAMARGIPVISTNTGAIPELVTEGVTGLLVPPKDSIALAEAIERLSRDSSLREKVIAGGHRVAANILSWEESCEKFYQQILFLLDDQRTERES